jgi:hypothetical protein
MEHNRGTFLILGLIVLLTCAPFGSASTPPVPQPIATLDPSESLPEEAEELILSMVAFSSDNSIALWMCQTAVQGLKCSQYAVQWENGYFGPITQTREPPRWGWGGRLSADGSRRLFAFGEREVPIFQRVLEGLRTITTLGMSGNEDSNREVVRVKDTVTRNSCFEWRRSFPMRWNRGSFAAISPSGELVAIAADNKLSIYRLPAVCEGPTKVRDK